AKLVCQHAAELCHIQPGDQRQSNREIQLSSQKSANSIYACARVRRKIHINALWSRRSNQVTNSLHKLKHDRLINCHNLAWWCDCYSLAKEWSKHEPNQRQTNNAWNNVSDETPQTGSFKKR